MKKKNYLNKKQTFFKVYNRYTEKLKLFMYMFEIDQFEWFFHDRGNGRKKKLF